jgi:hypothetical protein
MVRHQALTTDKSRLWLAGVVVIVLSCFSWTVAGEQADKPAAGALESERARAVTQSTDPNQLVAKVVDNEIHARDEGRFIYRDWRKTPEGEKTKQMVETSDGVVARLIAINNQALTQEQRADEDARLSNLLQHPELQKQKEKEQRQDEERVRKMFRELPKAFIYQYDGVEPGPSGELIKLKFAPNPRYDPPSRETSVYRAMSGLMLVQVPDLRMARIEATLFRDVNFGWGILGHLDKGGHFYIEQSKVGPDRWDATYMNIQFTGKALLFKTINLRQVEKLWDFRRVSDGLTLAQGIEMLKKSESQVAENAPAGH